MCSNKDRDVWKKAARDNDYFGAVIDMFQRFTI